MPPVLDLAAVGVVLGRLRTGSAAGYGDAPLTAKTVSAYMTESRPGGRYENHPFPEPDGYVAKAPFWMATRIPEIEAWALNRAGQGAGGGRPRIAG